MNSRTGRDREQGASLIEAAIVLPILLAVMIGILEFGLVFKDWLTVSHGAREGARAGAAYGDNPASNFLVLTEIGNHLESAGLTVQGVEIYNVETGETDLYDYAPGTGCGGGTGCCDWQPCPNPDRGPGPPYVEPNWTPATRDITAPETDTIGVTVDFEHQWVTGVLADTSDFSTTVEYHIEPQLFDPDD